MKVIVIIVLLVSVAANFVFGDQRVDQFFNTFGNQMNDTKGEKNANEIQEFNSTSMSPEGNSTADHKRGVNSSVPEYKTELSTKRTQSNEFKGYHELKNTGIYDELFDMRASDEVSASTELPQSDEMQDFSSTSVSSIASSSNDEYMKVKSPSLENATETSTGLTDSTTYSNGRAFPEEKSMTNFTSLHDSQNATTVNLSSSLMASYVFYLLVIFNCVIVR